MISLLPRIRLQPFSLRMKSIRVPFSLVLAYCLSGYRQEGPILPELQDTTTAGKPVPGWYGLDFIEPGRQIEDPYSQFRELRERQPVNLTPDGGFVMIRSDRDPTLTRLHVVLNWSQELERLVPTRH